MIILRCSHCKQPALILFLVDTIELCGNCAELASLLGSVSKLYELFNLSEQPNERLIEINELFTELQLKYKRAILWDHHRSQKRAS